MAMENLCYGSDGENKNTLVKVPQFHFDYQ